MKTLIEMAREAGLIVDANQSGFDSVEHFAALVRADERRACEKVCKDLYTKWVEELVNDANEEDDPPPPDWLDCKSAIEARGNT